MHSTAKDIYKQIHEGLLYASPERLGFSRKAFRMLPRLDKPCILDVGCGHGGPTLELAKLSKGEVVGLDIDQTSLDELSMRIKNEGLLNRVHLVNGSMLEICFHDESFDIIWVEGAIQFIGFEKALDDWRRFIKPDGFLVIHEMACLQPDPPHEIADHWRQVYPGIRTVPEYVEEIERHGYDLIGHFSLPEDFWWRNYYGPLQDRIVDLLRKYGKDAEALKVLDKEQVEIELFKKYSKWYGSAFFVMQKRNNRKGF